MRGPTTAPAASAGKSDARVRPASALRGVCARSPEISRISAVRSRTFVMKAFSRLRLLNRRKLGVDDDHGRLEPARRRCDPPRPCRCRSAVAGTGRVSGTMKRSMTLRPIAAVRPTASSSRASASRSQARARGTRLGLDMDDECRAQRVARVVVSGRLGQAVSATGVSSCSWIGPSGITVEIACL